MSVLQNLEHLYNFLVGSGVAASAYGFVKGALKASKKFQTIRNIKKEEEAKEKANQIALTVETLLTKKLEELGYKKEAENTSNSESTSIP